MKVPQLLRGFGAVIAVVVALTLLFGAGLLWSVIQREDEEAPSRAGGVQVETLPPDAELSAPLHLPARRVGEQKVPLLVLLHGYGGSGEDLERHSELSRTADELGFAWLAPSGPQDAITGYRYWNAGESCCGGNGKYGPDHVGALRRLITRTIASAPIDPARVYVGGYSNGGFMAHRFGCEASELVRGIVSISGAGPIEPVTCRAPTSLRVLQISGNLDTIVSYEGGHLFSNPSLHEHVSAQKTVGDWASRLGCNATPQDAGRIDLEPGLPGDETRISRFEGCRSGEVQLWTVDGGEHNVGYRAPAVRAIWRFLNE